MPADVPRLGEVRREEALLGRVLQAVRGGQVDEPVRVERVGRVRAIEVIAQANGGRLAGDVAVQRPGPRAVAAQLRGEQVVHVPTALPRRVRHQFGAAPDDLDLLPVGEPLERALELALADVAERAQQIRPDLNLHACRPSSPRRPGRNGATPSASSAWACGKYRQELGRRVPDP